MERCLDHDLFQSFDICRGAFKNNLLKAVKANIIPCSKGRGLFESIL